MTKNNLHENFDDFICDHEPSDLEVIGFDLGHGKTALASIRADATSKEMEMIDLTGKAEKKFMITAYAKDKRTNVITIGDSAYDLLETDYEDVSQFEITFKGILSDQNRIKIKTFVKAVYERVKDKLNKSLTPVFFIGHPSGWSEENSRAYCQLFCQAGIPNGIDVPESRAALMRARDSRAFTVALLNKPILVIDIGSSTTDFTLVVGEEAEEPDDPSDYCLGGSLIDKAILQYSLDKDQAQNKDCIDRNFEQFPKKKKLCEIMSRRVKEEYFSNYQKYRDKPQLCICLSGMTPTKEIDVGVNFMWKINHNAMSAIVNQPLEALDGKSWKQAFEEKLRYIKQTFDDKKINPRAIYISGGAYRMYFVREICEDVFCKDTDTIIISANEPELDVARGLASWGKHYVATAKFKREVDQFCKKPLKGIIKSCIPTLWDSLAELMIEELINKAIKPCLQDWKQGRIKSIIDLESMIEQEARAFFKKEGDALNQQVRKELTKWAKKPLLDKVGVEINSIGKKYGLTEGTLGFKFDKDKSSYNISHEFPVDFTLPPVLENIVGPITGVVVGAIVGIIDWIFVEVAWGAGGPLVAGIVAVFVFFLGKKKFEEGIKNLDLFPKWMKGMLLSDEKIDRSLAQEKEKIQEILKKELKKKKELEDQIIADSQKSIQADIEKQTHRAAFLLEQ